MSFVLREAEEFLHNVLLSQGRSAVNMSREQLLELYERVHSVLGLRRLSTSVKKMSHARLIVEVTNACLEAKFSATATRVMDALLPGHEQFVKLTATSAICRSCYCLFDGDEITWDGAVREAYKRLRKLVDSLAGELNVTTSDLLPVSPSADTRTWVSACAILVEVVDEYSRAYAVQKTVAPLSVILTDKDLALGFAVRFPNKEDMK